MIHSGDLFDVLPTLAAASVDACVTDPPYGIGFMGRKWDTFKPGQEAERVVANQQRESENPNVRGRQRSPASSPSAVEYNYTLTGLHEFEAWTERWAREVFRVLKPGAYIVVCGAPRSYHRMACGLEDAGFVIRDKFAWLFGSGFPKNYDLGDGKGTALKPAHEPIALAWKPFKGAIKACHEQHGTAALNIDACRIGTEQLGWLGGSNTDSYGGFSGAPGAPGRWPANVVIDEEAAEAIDEQSGVSLSGNFPANRNGLSMWAGDGGGLNGTSGPARAMDVGGASRFYYCAKPSRAERDEGCYGLSEKSGNDVTGREPDSAGAKHSARAGTTQAGRFNSHPTVKPIDLMRWLVRLVTPIGGTVLDPFMGSGTTGCACAFEARPFIGIEREAEYFAIAERRIGACVPLFSEAVSQ